MNSSISDCDTEVLFTDKYLKDLICCMGSIVFILVPWKFNSFKCSSFFNGVKSSTKHPDNDKDSKFLRYFKTSIFTIFLLQQERVFKLVKFLRGDNSFISGV